MFQLTVLALGVTAVDLRLYHSLMMGFSCDDTAETSERTSDGAYTMGHTMGHIVIATMLGRG